MMQSTSLARIRRAESGDLRRILALYQQLSAGSSHPRAAGWEPSERHEAALLEILENPRYHQVVLEVDGQVQGTATLYILPDLDRGGSAWGVVEHVVVEEGVRGRGHGARLMGEVIRLARDAGCYKLSLSSGNQRTDTHRFYEGIGFRSSSKGFSIYFDG